MIRYKSKKGGYFMRNTVLEKDNGKVIDLPKTKEVIYELHNGSRIKHLCFDCVRGCASKCAKIADYRKKPITAYDFIISGYQIYDNRGDVEEFTVTECQNYIKVIKKLINRKLFLNISFNFNYFFSSLFYTPFF